jgi:hypothetical protein
MEVYKARGGQCEAFSDAVKKTVLPASVRSERETIALRRAAKKYRQEARRDAVLKEILALEPGQVAREGCNPAVLLDLFQRWAKAQSEHVRRGWNHRLDAWTDFLLDAAPRLKLEAERDQAIAAEAYRLAQPLAGVPA